MKNSVKIAFILCVTVLSGMVSCHDAEYDTLGLHAYVNESAAGKVGKVTITDSGVSTEITACLSNAATQDVKLRFVVDPTVLDRYNKKEASSFIVLPEDVYELNPEVTIKAGEYSAEVTKIKIKPLPKQYIGESYALPLRLESVDGSIATTSTTSTYVIVTEAITTDAHPMFNGGSGLSTNLKFPLTLPQFTVEIRFQVSNTSVRNRAVFSGGGVLLRFEDPQSDVVDGFKAHSQIQFQGNGWYLNPSIASKTNIWQHLALTYDGKVVTIYINGVFAGSREGVIDPNFDRVSWLGGNGGSTVDAAWRNCLILCAEARIWSVCRTEAQIQNNITTTSAKSPGLEAYWRFNEGKGNEFADLTGNGHTMSSLVTPTWIEGIKSTDKQTPWPVQ